MGSTLSSGCGLSSFANSESATGYRTGDVEYQEPENAASQQQQQTTAALIRRYEAERVRLERQLAEYHRDALAKRAELSRLKAAGVQIGDSRVRRVISAAETLRSMSEAVETELADTDRLIQTARAALAQAQRANKAAMHSALLTSVRNLSSAAADALDPAAVADSIIEDASAIRANNLLVESGQRAIASSISALSNTSQFSRGDVTGGASGGAQLNQEALFSWLETLPDDTKSPHIQASLANLTTDPLNTTTATSTTTAPAAVTKLTTSTTASNEPPPAQGMVQRSSNVRKKLAGLM
jgi:hypothetical protein